MTHPQNPGGYPPQGGGYGPPGGYPPQGGGYGPPGGYPQGYPPGGPYGGYPPQPPPQKKSSAGKIALGILGAVVLCGVIGSLGDKSGNTSRPASALDGSNDQRSGAKNDGSPQEAPKPAAPEVEVDAKKYWQDYQDNEVAADDKYKGKKLLVSGVVSSIDKDFMDNIVVKLATPNQFMSVMATMESTEKATAAKLKKGQKVSVFCTGGTMVIGSPQLSDCTFR